MAGAHENLEVTVLATHSPEDRLTTASFIWPIAPPEDTYTIAIDSGLSLELDRHFPVRLSRIALYDYAPDASIAFINRLTAPELGEAMTNGPRIGMFVMSLSVSRENRLLLASIQASSPSTPPRMRRAIITMLKANRLDRKTVAT